MLFKNRAFIELESIDSTNNYAANLLRLSGAPEGTVITAHSQTGGRGQRGSSWESAPGENLLMSIILYPQRLMASDQFYLSMIIALAVRDFIESSTMKDTYIKWPNDVIVDDKKLAGILIEINWQDNKIQSVIAGIGVNLNQKNFENPRAASVSIFSKQYHSPIDSCELLSNSIEKYYMRLTAGKYSDINREYHSHLYGLGKRRSFIYKGAAIKGIIKGVDQTGALVVEHETGADIKCELKEIEFVY